MKAIDEPAACSKCGRKIIETRFDKHNSKSTMEKQTKIIKRYILSKGGAL